MLVYLDLHIDEAYIDKAEQWPPQAKEIFACEAGKEQL